MQYEAEPDVIAAVIAAYPIFLRALPYNIGVTVTDREKYLLYEPAENLDLKLPVGQPVREGSLVHRAMVEKRKVFMKVDKSARGLPYIGSATPICGKNGEIVGAFAISMPVEKYEKTKDMANELNVQMRSVASTCEQVSAQVEEISAISKGLLHKVHDSQAQAKGSEKVLQLLRGIVNQTNLLGLNASIEAARVGTYGRGFHVVAEEIRKLAANGADSVKNVVDIVGLIQSNSGEIVAEVRAVEQSVTRIADAMASLAAITQQVSVLAGELDLMANELTQKE